MVVTRRAELELNGDTRGSRWPCVPLGLGLQASSDLTLSPEHHKLRHRASWYRSRARVSCRSTSARTGPRSSLTPATVPSNT